MPVQRTLVLLKPDAVQRGLIGEIISRFERKALRVIGMKLTKPSQDVAAKHYAEHKERPFFPSLLQFITSSPLVALVLEGDDAIAVVRGLIGPTDGRKAPPGTIRGDYALSKSNNLVHASDSPESAERELAIWFSEGLVSWKRCDTVWAETE
ncbi:MAG: nucleoside-diphosphate kinase [Planctomycetes bacterium]|nr:nucleoside-diphosphate kinase [Planctomycetota bacterium]